MSDGTGEWVDLDNGRVSISVDPHGAQLMSLRRAGGDELLWQGDPDIWARRAPILFPVIGPVPDGQILHGGRRYPMPTHGFARDSDFAVVERDETSATFELRTNEATRVHYPFDFALRVAFSLSGETVACAVTVANEGDEPMPADIGFHPGFNWPLTPGIPKERYVVTFAEPEPDPIRRGVDNPIFLTDEAHPTPVEGDVFRPRDELFEANAIVLDKVRSRSVRFGPTGDDVPAGAVAIEVAYPDSPYLALWTRPGPYLCIEPWQGLPAPVGFDGPLSEKPGVAIIEPGTPRTWRLLVSVVDAG